MMKRASQLIPGDTVILDHKRHVIREVMPYNVMVGSKTINRASRNSVWIRVGKSDSIWVLDVNSEWMVA